MENTGDQLLHQAAHFESEGNYIEEIKLFRQAIAYPSLRAVRRFAFFYCKFPGLQEFDGSMNISEETIDKVYREYIKDIEDNTDDFLPVKALIFLHGNSNPNFRISPKKQEAVFILEDCVQKKNPIGTFIFGQYCESGLVNIRINPYIPDRQLRETKEHLIIQNNVKALSAYKVAYTEGFTAAAWKIAEYYQNGWGGLQKNLETAKSFEQVAASSGYSKDDL